MGLICSLSHTQHTIDESINEYPVALVSNKAVVLISLLLSSIHEVVKVSSAKKLSGKNDNDTINSLSPSLLKILAEVKRFLIGLPVSVLSAPSVQPCFS